MPQMQNLLAETDGGMAKVVIGIVVVAFWIISGIAQTLGKKQQDKKRKAQLPTQDGSLADRQAQLERELRERQARLREQTPTPPPLPTAQRPQNKRPQPKRPQPRRPQPVPILETALPSPITLPATATARPLSRQVRALRADLTPATLSKQIVLMEILGKPIALREGESVF